MTLPFACSCGIDPATETMAAQMGIALVLSAPFWFRERITATARRLLGRSHAAEADVDADECSGD